MTEIFLAPCSKQGGDSRAYQNLQQTVLNPVDLSDYEDIVPEPYQGEYRVWGLTDGLERSWIRISDGDYLLFYTGDRTYRYAARVLGKEHNLELSIKLWPNYQAGETGGEDPGKPWEYLIYLAEPTAVNIDSAWLDSLADNQSEYPVGFRRLNDTGNRRLRDRFGSIEEFIQEKMTNSETSDESDGGGAGKTLDQDEFVPDIQPPKRTDATISRIIRNTERAKDLIRTERVTFSQIKATVDESPRRCHA